MQRAGRAVADGLLDDFLEIGGLAENPAILVLAGKGHNAGDALLAAAEIAAVRPGASVDVVFVFGDGTLRPLARRSWERLRGSGADVRVLESPTADARAAYDLCLDGIFGFQFRPPMDEATAALVSWANDHPRVLLRAAVDLPSGVGERNADTVFRADFTYATGIVKAPLLESAVAESVGRLRYLDLGFFDRDARENVTDRVLLAEILRPLADLRPAASDKRTYGHLFVIGGSRSFPGAVLMAVESALRSGVGLLTAFVPESLAPAYAAKLPETMWVGFPEEADGGGLGEKAAALVREKLDRADALAIGPGLGRAPQTIRAVEAIVREGNAPLVLDADALQPEILAAAHNRRLICTPHAGEFKRITGESPGNQPNRSPSPPLSDPLRDTCRAHPNRVVVLKGPITRVGAGDRIYHSLFGGPVLARGGSGDILAGIVGAMAAQTPDDLLLAAARGVVWHGRAADLLARDKGQVAVQTTQLLDHLKPALDLARHAP